MKNQWRFVVVNINDVNDKLNQLLYFSGYVLNIFYVVEIKNPLQT